MATSLPPSPDGDPHTDPESPTVLQGFTELARTFDEAAEGDLFTKIVKAIGLVQLGLARATSQGTAAVNNGLSAGPHAKLDFSYSTAPLSAESLPITLRPRSSSNAQAKSPMFALDRDLVMTTQATSGHLKPDEYAALIELLASALREDDVSKRAHAGAVSGRAAHFDGPILHPRPSDLDPDKMARGWKGKARALGRRALSRGSPPPPRSVVPTTSSPSEDMPSLVGLLERNLRLMSQLLRTSSSSSQRQSWTSDEAPKLEVTGVSEDEAEGQDLGEGTSQKVSADEHTTIEETNQPSLLLRLPPELQRRIFQLARKFSEDASAWVTPVPSFTMPLDGNRRGIRTSRSQILTAGITETNFLASAAPPPLPPVNTYPDVFDLDGYPLPPPGVPRSLRRDPKGGRRKAQEYAHTLAAICRSLHGVPRRAAFDSVHVRTRRQVVMLVKLWKGEFDEYDSFAEQVDAVPKVQLAIGEEVIAERRRRRPVGSSRGWDNSPMSSVESFETIVSDPALKKDLDNADKSNKEDCEEQEGGEQPSKYQKETKISRVEEAKSARLEELRSAGNFVRYLNIEVPAVTDELDRDFGNSRPPRRRPRRGRNGYGYTGLRTAPDLNACLADLQASRKAANEAEKGQLPELFALVPNLWELTLCVQPGRGSPAFSGGLSTQGYGIESLENEVLGALCGLKSLRKLTLRQSIDFSELEVLMPCLPELTELRLDGGLDNVDGRGDVDVEADHECRLRLFTLQNFDFESGDVSAEQLRWILDKSVGVLEHLDLIMYAGGGAHQNWVNAEGGLATSPFACRTFADLLVRLAPTLKHLALRDCSSFGQAHNDLSNAPHNGYLDYALLHCIKLQHLAIEWFVTGNTLLDCLLYTPEVMAERGGNDDESVGTSPQPTSSGSGDALIAATATSVQKVLRASTSQRPRPLKTMTFFGSPERTCAKSLADMLTQHKVTLCDDDKDDERDEWGGSSSDSSTKRRHLAFPFLESITLSAFPNQRSGQFVPWPSRDLRKLKQACQSRNVWLGFAS